MGGHAFSHKRAELFHFPSDALIVIGHDTEHVAGSHPLWRKDCDNIPDDDFVASIRKHGFIQPIRARKLPKGTAYKLLGRVGEYASKLSPEELDTHLAEIVVGRERVKAGRILAEENPKLVVPTLLWPAGTSLAEIIGAANAENYQRKHESVTTQAEHVYMQMRAEGYGDGIEELTAAKNVMASTGFSVQRIRNLLAYREDDALVRAVERSEKGEAGGVKGEAALALATLPSEERTKQLALIIADPSLGRIEEVRERVAYSKATTKATTKAAQPAKGASKSTKVVHNGASSEDGPALGISKPLARRIVTQQMDLAADERDVEQLVLKVLKVTSGLAAPSSVPGLTKAMKRLGL